MGKLFGAILLVVMAVMPSASFAGALAVPITVPIYSENEDTVFSIGLRLEFGDIVKPSVVVAVRRTETDINNDVTGGLAEIAFSLSPDNAFAPTFRVMGIYGDTSVQGLAGIGFDFGKKQWLLGLGAQGDFVDGGVNIGADGAFSPYIGASSYEGAPTRKVNVMVPPK